MASNYYVRPPITRRLSTDETDTESVISLDSYGSSQGSFLSSDDESVSEFAGYLNNHESNLQRRRQAQLELDRTLHDAQARMQDAYAEAGRLYLQNMGRLERLWFNIEVTFVTIARLAVRFFWWFLNLATVLGFRLVGELRNLFKLLMKPVVYLLTFGLLIQPFISGYKGMNTHACHDPTGVYASSASCNSQTDIKAKADLADLTAAHETIIVNVKAIYAPFDLDKKAIEKQMQETVNVGNVIDKHQQRFTQPEKLKAAMETLNDDILKISSSATKFESDYLIQRDEAVQRLYNIVHGADRIKPHTSSERFHAEAIHLLFPFIYSHSRTTRLVREYIQFAAHIAQTPETKALLEQHDILSTSYLSLRDALGVVRQSILKAFPAEAEDCASDSSGKPRCDDNPRVALSRFIVQLQHTQTAIDRIEAAHDNHEKVLQGLNDLHFLLAALLKDAHASYGEFYRLNQTAAEAERDGTPTRKPTESRTARAILYQFVARLRGERRRMETPSNKKKGVSDSHKRNAPRVCHDGKCTFYILPQ